ncbi:hypothetical protein [Dactylosporangium fulvum]|uniref:Uncharacterized protein n=1 Tax=Dactylosporangium fulvum TaxID=53359 RepID=A0ABY5VUF7_9ACTN|nr:hypothetical protein [Dactylosporangium fulvum]UWP81378.1 hypothetical protein Dfulv_40680 [Dactylosporangium fulvum]
MPQVLAELGACVLPWEQATRHRFDLAVAAAYGGLHELHAPIVVMAHGAGRGKRSRPRRAGGPVLADPVVYGLDGARLTRDGRVLASALILAHEDEREVLSRQCPEALDVAVLAGDPCFDRLVVSLPLRQRYRDAMGLGGAHRLVVVSSTWGGDGLFGGTPDLLPRLLDQLPAGFRVAALLHPAVWGAHGRRQVSAWLRDCRDAGLLLLDPTADWRGLVIAADCLIGDHGSVTVYAAAIGRPLLYVGGRRAATAPGSAHELVAAAAARLDPGRALLPQVRAARPLDAPAVAAALTSRPGQAGPQIRRTMYRLLRLRVPGRHRRPEPVPAPRFLGPDR